MDKIAEIEFCGKGPHSYTLPDEFSILGGYKVNSISDRSPRFMTLVRYDDSSQLSRYIQFEIVEAESYIEGLEKYTAVAVFPATMESPTYILLADLTL